MHVSTVSVLISTFNRAPLLADTLESLAHLRVPPDCAVEVIVVDNNSTDDTRAVVESASRKCEFAFAYEFEPRQGKSIALNRGLSVANGEVIALTDDDVLTDPAWLERVVAAFRLHDISFTFGKVLPRWSAPPPHELLTQPAQEIWGPLALIDYGEESTAYTDANFGKLRLPIGANLAFSRQALVAIRGWRPDLGKVNNSLIAGEDFEIFFRLRNAGLYAGLYDPHNVVYHYVPKSRLNRLYFRKWFFWHGRTMARMLPETYPEIDFSRARRLLGAPRFLYRQALGQGARWLSSRWKRDRLRRVIEEMYACRDAGLLFECWQQRRTVHEHAKAMTFAPAETTETADRIAD